MRIDICPACGGSVAVDFYRDEHPLSMIAWPKTATEAVQMKRLPLDFVRCVDCGHIYNAAFEYAEVPYSAKPNLMFNQGAKWAEFIASLQQRLLDAVGPTPTVVEIGHGDGSFLAALAQLAPQGQFIGFDPCGAVASLPRIELRAALFDPFVHCPALRPHLFVARHVIEHLKQPMHLIQQLHVAAQELDSPLWAYFETPCVDRLVTSGRTVDLYYEHFSQFTQASFERLLRRAGGEIVELGTAYDGEVVFGVMKLGRDEHQQRYRREAAQFRQVSTAALETIPAQLLSLRAQDKRIAIWGGVGKSAAFINRYRLDAERFPLVVDSDPAKVDTFVPGTGQRIQFRDVLKDVPADVVVIPPQWRARDIVLEMQRHEIVAEQILIEHDGQLVDFLRGDHPYLRP